MKSVIYKNKFGLKSAHIWFKNTLNEGENADIIKAFGVSSNLKNGIKKEQNTLIINLKDNEDVIYNNINKTVRYEINRCEKENIKFEFYDSSMLKNNSEIVSKFKDCYDNMYKAKGLDTFLNINDFNKYIDSNLLVLTIAVDNENEELAYHVYVVTDEKVRLLYSCSNFRSDSSKKSLIGRANKYLHWKDILKFKQENKIEYDFGGINSFTDPNGIDKFKLAFGGEQRKYYNVIYGNSFLGKILVFLYKLKGNK
ncbi:MAG: hypothetical protein IJ501_01925 [Bacilli bacterium]|nr:hypothetical protein [Bacilli bacterium]